MNREEEVKDPRLFDVRTVERNIKRGLVTRKDYEKHLKSLPDAGDKMMPVETEQANLPPVPPAHE
jgi:hypothetical protein